MKSLVVILLLFFSYYSIRMTLKFHKCFFGSTWDWVQFSKQLERTNIFSLYRKEYSFENDFENVALSYPYTTVDSVHKSGMYSAKITPDREYTTVYSIPMRDLGERLPHYINFNFWALNPFDVPNEALVVCSFDQNDTNIVWQSQPLSPVFTKQKEWQRLNIRFVIPDQLSRDSVIKLYFWNPKRSIFFVDDLKVEFN